MTAALRVETPGPLCTLQDLGRRGWRRFGIPVSGAMDPVALGVANALVGNPQDTAAVELTLIGGSFAVEGAPVRFAVAGGDFPLFIDDRPAATSCSHTLQPGQRLRIGSTRLGVRGYLAVAGGFAIEPVLDSLSTHVRSGLGGLDGKPLAAGDRLPLAAAELSGPDMWLPPEHMPSDHPRVRVVLGPQDDHFTARAIALFQEVDYTVSPQSDRMGYRLSGPPLEHTRGFDVISDAIVPGSIQVPGTGEPIVLMADAQTTGGYPKIATVIGADLPALGQRRPGDRLRFEAVTLEAAVAARRELVRWLAALPELLVPVGRGADAERLLAVNLISGVTDGHADR